MSFWGKLFKKSSDEWVFIGSNDSITDYYDPTSVKIYKDPPSCITVTCKRVYTNKGKNFLFDFRESQGLSNDNIMNIHHSLTSYNLYYKERKKTILMTTNISKSGEILGGGSIIGSDSPPEDDINPGTVDDMILNKLIQDYNL
jgi:hypothetical protein